MVVRSLVLALCAAFSMTALDACGGTVEPLDCALGEESCESGCIDILTDVENCGGCGRFCAPGRACSEGTCIDAGDCPAGTQSCDNTCANTSIDADHCGDCATRCRNRICELQCRHEGADACCCKYGCADSRIPNGRKYSCWMM